MKRCFLLFCYKWLITPDAANRMEVAWDNRRCRPAEVRIHYRDAARGQIYRRRAYKSSEKGRNKMKIFQGVIEIAGQIGIFCKGLKQRGHLAVGYNMFHTFLNYRSHLINKQLHELQVSFRHMLHFFDLFHYHHSVTLFPGVADLYFIRALRKKMIVHHWGNDVRFHDQARKNNPYVYTGDSPPNELIHRQLTLLGRMMKESIVQDHEVLAYVKPYFERVHVLPIAIDLSRFPYMGTNAPQSRIPLIVHAPTNPLFKGTEAIERALEALKPTYNFRYLRIEKMNHDTAARMYREADIIVDQVLCGSYGLLSVEAMALGKPVVTYIRDDLIDTFPAGLPIVNANPDTLARKLAWLLDNRDVWPHLAKAGRSYVERHHAMDAVVPKLLTIYANLK